MDLFKRILQATDLYDDNRVELNNGGMLVKPSADGSRPGYARDTFENVEGVPFLKKGTTQSGQDFYQASISTKNTEAGPGLRKRFSFNNKGKKEAAEAIKKHLKKYPDILKNPEYRGQKTIKKRADGVLTYQKRGQPTKTYDPKDYGSEDKAFKAAQADVEASRIAKTTAAKVDVDIDKVKKLRAQGLSINKIADRLGLDNRTISNALIEVGETTKNLKVRSEMPKEIQKDLKAKFSSVKNWDFKKYVYGISPSSDIKTYDRIREFIDDPKPYEIAGDFSKAEGWLAQQMNRSYKLGNQDYIPIKKNINNKSKIIGFIDNSQYGEGKKYIVNDKFIKGKHADGVPFSEHVDYKETAKLVDISKKAKLPVQGALKELLANEGVDTTRISLSDLFKYMKGEVGIEGTKNALERHHIKGVGVRATGDYQLLNRDLNVLARDVSKEIEQGNLSRVSELRKKGVMVGVGDKVYGSGPKTLGGQFRRFERELFDFYKNNPQAKKVIMNLEKLGCGLSGGGRVFYNEGGIGLTRCADKGRAKLENIVLKGGGSQTEKGLAQVILNTGRSLGSGFTARGLFGPAALAFTAATEAGLVGYDMLSKGLTFREAVGDSLFNYALGDKTKIDPKQERYKRYQDVGFNQEQIGKIAAFENQIDELNQLNQNFAEFGQAAQSLTGTGSQRLNPLAREKAEQKVFEEYPAFNQDIFRAGVFDRLNIPQDEGARLYGEAERMSALQKLGSTGPQIMGTIFPKFEEQRQEDIANILRGGLAGGGIAGLSGGADKGPPPKSGKTPHGLLSLKNNVKNY